MAAHAQDPIKTLLDQSEEALIISVSRITGEPRLVIHHKILPIDGILNGYLTSILGSLLGPKNGKGDNNQVDCQAANGA